MMFLCLRMSVAYFAVLAGRAALETVSTFEAVGGKM
jgi:hypothetical protein